MEIKKINVNDKEYMFINESRSTRSGFAHDSELFINGCKSGYRNTCHYLNRTWEYYRYQSVMKGLVYKMIEDVENNIAFAYKQNNNIKRLTASHREKLETIIAEDKYIAELEEVYNAL